MGCRAYFSQSCGSILRNFCSRKNDENLLTKTGQSVGWRHDSSDDSVVLVAGSVIKHWKRIVVQYDERERLETCIMERRVETYARMQSLLG
jgi:hypothetical protein